MRTTLNLSARPFANHRLLYIAIAALLLISLWLYLWTISERGLVKAKADSTALRVRDAQDRLDKARQDSQKTAQAEQQPPINDAERLELASARQLLARRAFSMNRLMAELEHYVPKDARLIGVKIEKLAPLGQPISASVEVKAIGKTAAQMTEMMEKVEKSGGLFSIRQSTQEASQETTEVPFTLILAYSPAGGEAQ
jgi:predicted Holliday junction resolvase-like endonuclease